MRSPPRRDPRPTRRPGDGSSCPNSIAISSVGSFAALLIAIVVARSCSPQARPSAGPSSRRPTSGSPQTRPARCPSEARPHVGGHTGPCGKNGSIAAGRARLSSTVHEMCRSTAVTPGTIATMRSTHLRGGTALHAARIETTPSVTPTVNEAGSSHNDRSRHVLADRPLELVVRAREGADQVGSGHDPDERSAVDHRQPVDACARPSGRRPR